MVKKDNLVTKKYLGTELKKLRGDITGMKDTIMNELKAMREDDAAHQYQHQTTNDTLDNHEVRLRKLEKPSL